MAKASWKEVAAACGRAALDVACETIWPTRCAVCDLPGELICDACARALAFIDTWRACPRCGAPFGRVQCTECNTTMLASGDRTELPLAALASAVVLDRSARRIVLAYKDQGERRLSAVIAQVMARYVPPSWTAPQSGRSPAVAFVPATSAARRRRGFDHAEKIAHDVAEALDLEVAPVLARPRSRDQRKLTRTQRLANLSGRMTLLAGATVPDTVILVDDVCTTGATLYSAAEAMQNGGAKTVYGLTFARAWS